MGRQPEPEAMDVPREAEAYALADFAEVNEAFVARLHELAGTRDNLLAADLGTGPGDIPLRLLRVRPSWRVVAVDAALPMLHFARQAGAVSTTPKQVCGCCPGWVQADAKALPFPSQRFDVVFSNSILHHITDVGPFWSEVRRVAKPAGLVFLRDLARPSGAQAARAIVGRYASQESRLLQEEFYRSLLSAYTPEEVRSQLARAGLASLEVAKVTDRHLDIFGRLG